MYLSSDQTPLNLFIDKSMQNNSTLETILLFPTPGVEEIELDRECYIYLQTQIDYMASRLHAALQSFANREKDHDNEKWWLEGFQYEMVRHTACLPSAG